VQVEREAQVERELDVQEEYFAKDLFVQCFVLVEIVLLDWRLLGLAPEVVQQQMAMAKQCQRVQQKARTARKAREAQ
jgi:hypothetical protein